MIKDDHAGFFLDTNIHRQKWEEERGSDGFLLSNHLMPIYYDLYERMKKKKRWRENQLIYNQFSLNLAIYNHEINDDDRI